LSIAIVKIGQGLGYTLFGGYLMNSPDQHLIIGDQPLVILNNPQVQVIVGCCPPRAVLSTRVIQPGQEATITLNFSMHQGMDGKHRFHIDLQTNDPKEPNKQLVVLSNWI